MKSGLYTLVFILFSTLICVSFISVEVVHEPSGAGIDGMLSTSTLVASSPPVNCDNTTCETAIPIGEGTFFNDTICGDGVDQENVCGYQWADGESWYIYIPEESGIVTVSSSLDPDTSDTRLLIISGTCEDQYCVGADDDGGIGFTSLISFEANAGQTYYIVWDDHWFDSGGFQFSVSREALVGLDENEPSYSSYKIYPNPASDYLEITSDILTTGPITVRIMDMLGRIVSDQSIVVDTVNDRYQLDISLLDEGLYMITFENGGQTYVKELMVERP